jgi:hypothetical protein
MDTARKAVVQAPGQKYAPADWMWNAMVIGTQCETRWISFSTLSPLLYF